jgi:hypothetical protein
LNNEFWMPAPVSGPDDFSSLVFERLTAREQAVLRRLLRSQGSASFRRQSRVRQRAALRQRRRVLNRLGITDVRSLVHIVMELGL